MRPSATISTADEFSGSRPVGSSTADTLRERLLDFFRRYFPIERGELDELLLERLR